MFYEINYENYGNREYWSDTENGEQHAEEREHCAVKITQLKEV